jgi:ribosome-associated protein
VPGDLVVTSTLVIPGAELSERFSRSSGPGGQGVNTTDSRVELSFDVAGSAAIPEHVRARMLERLRTRLAGGVLTVVASQYRAQRANRQAARERMARLLREAAAQPPPRRRPTRPTRSSQERRLTDKRRRAEVKRDRQQRFDA